MLAASSSSSNDPVTQSLWDKKGGVKNEWVNNMLTKNFSIQQLK